MKYFAMDIGAKTIGLAASDESGTLASPIGTLTRRGWQRDLAALAQAITGAGAEAVVVGYPVHVSGQPGEAVDRVERLAGKLKGRLGLPIFGVDERYTTLEAKEVLSGSPKRRRRRTDDNAIAAALILKRFLEEGDSAVIKRW